MSNSRQLITRPGALQAPQLDYILIDGSGSMSDKWHASLNALDIYMDALKAQNIHSHGIVQMFGEELSIIIRDETVANWSKFGLEPVRMCGGLTPLYDAINLMCRSLRDLDPPNASICIVTDGDENKSTHTSAAQARALLDWCRAKGWQVTFIGCDFNNTRQAKLLGANERNMLTVRAMKLLEAGETLAKKRINNIRTGADINFSDDEKENFGGYLTHG